jgi:outer membrane biosynthesis protein TonB
MEVRPGLAVSCVAHAVILGWGLLTFTPKPLEYKPVEAMPVDIVPISDTTQVKQGTPKATAKPDAKPTVEKQADPKELKELVEKVTKQPEIKPAAAPPPPTPEPKPAEAKTEQKPEPKPEPKEEALKKPEPPKKPEPSKEQTKATPATKMKAAPTKRDFDPNQIAALLDRRDPQRQQLTDARAPSAPSPGFTNGRAAQLSQTEIDALRRRLRECWNPPAGMADAGKLVVVLRVAFRPDGSVASAPELVAGSPSPLGPAMGESAKRAILTCQPFTMLKPEHYEEWKVMELTFDPRDMVGG